MENAVWTIPAEQLVFCPSRNALLVGRRCYALPLSAFITLIYLSLEPGNVLKETTGEKRLPVFLPEYLLRFLCSHLCAWKPSGDNGDI